MIRRLWLSTLILPIVLLAACGGTTNTATTAANAASTATSATSAPAAAPTTPGSSASSAGATTLTLDQSQSTALYKARETLANIGSPTEAVGKTSKISGQIVFTSSGAIDSAASRITLDLTTLQSDKSQRDNYIQRNTLNTAQYPDAVFVPTSVKGLSWPLPTTGQTTFTIVGDLTLHGKAALTTWNATATFAPKQVKGNATTSVKFEDFGMKPPSTMLVLSVEDSLTLEIDFVFNEGG